MTSFASTAPISKRGVSAGFAMSAGLAMSAGPAVSAGTLGEN